MIFEMEIKEIKQRKTSSNDHEFSIKLITNDHQLLALGAIPPNETILVEFKTSPEKESNTGEAS